VSLCLKNFTTEELCQDYSLLGYDATVWYIGVNKVEETVSCLHSQTLTILTTTVMRTTCIPLRGAQRRMTKGFMHFLSVIPYNSQFSFNMFGTILYVRLSTPAVI